MRKGQGPSEQPVYGLGRHAAPLGDVSRLTPAFGSSYPPPLPRDSVAARSSRRDTARLGPIRTESDDRQHRARDRQHHADRE
jgi:hypothetical protein